MWFPSYGLSKIEEERKWGVNEVFHLDPPFFSLPSCKEKMNEISIEKKVQNYP